MENAIYQLKIDRIEIINFVSGFLIKQSYFTLNKNKIKQLDLYKSKLTE